MGFRVGFIFIISLAYFGCKKEEHKVIPDNQSPDYSKISTLRVQNYVNRTYIDLLGREPTNVELDRDVRSLRVDELSIDSRTQFVELLQLDTTFHTGDSTYRKAYVQRLYDIGKSRLLEGVDDAELFKPIGLQRFALKKARLEGDSLKVESALNVMSRHQKLLNARWWIRKNIVGVDYLYSRLLNNTTFDKINMGSFNFINSAFEDLLGRFPTKQEYDESFNIIENGNPGAVFGKQASNKSTFCDIVANTKEFKEYMIRWAYKNYVGRAVTDRELEPILTQYINDNNYDKALKVILTTNEYAQFD